MKGILIILDGIGDKPNKKLEDKTPLEASKTPNLDFLSARGVLGWMYPVKPGFAPSSESGISSIFGNDWIFAPRGPLCAIGSDIKLTRGDLAFRVNFATIDSLKDKNIIDRRAGRTLKTSEAELLAKSINEKVKIPFKFEFKPTIQHRASLVFRGGFSDNVSGNDTSYINGKSVNAVKITDCKPLDEDENSRYTANLVNSFLEKVFEVLKNHPVNLERKKRGLLPANYLLIRSPGIEKPKLKQYKKWVSLGYMPLENGFAKASGMTNFSFNYPELKGLDSYENLWKGLKKACKFSIKLIKKNYKKADYAYIQIKETDLPGHDNKPIEKKNMIEYIDKTLFSFLRKFVPQNKIKVVVTADHSTVCEVKAHTSDPVPVLFYNDSIIRQKRFCEKDARKGSLGSMIGKELFKKVGFNR
jgi:2,3-bisphosphoglycerate-independent phosphoglycerate mutase